MKFNDVYDALQTRITTLFPTKSELPDPYMLENNSTTFLNNGFGIIIGEGDDGAEEFNTTVVEQNIGVVLTVDSQRQSTDPTLIRTIIKSVRTDHLTLCQSLLNGDLLGSAGTDRISFTGFSEPQFIFEDNKYLAIIQYFRMRITEQL